jgi:plastocyanin
MSAAAFLLVAGLAASEAAEITGKITFEGATPKMKKIKMEADPVCAELHAGQPLRSEEVVVNDNSTLKNVLVYVKKGAEGKKFDVPKDAVVLKQEGCHYVPHVFGIMVGQTLKIVNGDNTLHNIHAVPKANPEMNFAQPKKGDEKVTKFTRSEVVVPFKCDVHPWMSAYAAVLEHPFHSVSDGQGAFSIKGLPAGDYVIEAWHEKYGAQEQTVRVAETETKELEFKFKAAQ